MLLSSWFLLSVELWLTSQPSPQCRPPQSVKPSRLWWDTTPHKQQEQARPTPSQTSTALLVTLRPGVPLNEAPATSACPGLNMSTTCRSTSCNLHLRPVCNLLFLLLSQPPSIEEPWATPQPRACPPLWSGHLHHPR